MSATPADNAYIALNMVPGIGAVFVRTMTETLGSVETARHATAGELASVPGIGPARAEAFARALAEVDEEAQTLTASVTKPRPEYFTETWLVYGNEAAPRLSFSRSPCPASSYDEKTKRQRTSPCPPPARNRA